MGTTLLGMCTKPTHRKKLYSLHLKGILENIMQVQDSLNRDVRTCKFSEKLQTNNTHGVKYLVKFPDRMSEIPIRRTVCHYNFVLISSYL
jgi:hypothetical protein